MLFYAWLFLDAFTDMEADKYEKISILERKILCITFQCCQINYLSSLLGETVIYSEMSYAVTVPLQWQDAALLLAARKCEASTKENFPYILCMC